MWYLYSCVHCHASDLVIGMLVGREEGIKRVTDRYKYLINFPIRANIYLQVVLNTLLGNFFMLISSKEILHIIPSPGIIAKHAYFTQFLCTLIGIRPVVCEYNANFYHFFLLFHKALRIYCTTKVPPSTLQYFIIKRFSFQVPRFNASV